eukprot:g2103.t1
MVMLMLKTTSEDAEGIKAVEDQAKQLWNTSAAVGTTLRPGVATKFMLSETSPVTTFDVEVSSDGPHVIFAQHFAIEFEGFAGHYLKDNKGENVEPLAESPAAATYSDNAGLGILAAIITALVTFSGLLLVYPFIHMKVLSVEDRGGAARTASMFAAGALLSTAFIFIFPESLHSFAAAAQEANVESEIAQASGLGTSSLLGILTGATIALVFGIFVSGENKTKPSDPMDSYEQGGAQKETPAFDALKVPICEFQVKRWTGAAWSVLIGDFLHNFVDGVTIGIAFTTCDPATGWTVAVGTIGHEVAQEVADFLVLITKGKMSIGSAVLSNFLSGLSILFGALLGTSGSLTSQATGIFLGFSGGIYVWIAIGECLSVAVSNAKSAKDIAIYTVAFVVGALAIGVVLANHVHCGDHH